MACAKCGSKKGSVVEMTKQDSNDLQAKYNSGDWVLAKYNGPEQTHNIGSPSGVIAKFGMGIYGRGRNGGIFLVHKEDTLAKYGRFTAISGGAVAAAEKMLGLTPPVIHTVSAKAVAAVEEVANVKTIAPVETKTDDAVEEVMDIARVVVAEGRVLKRSEALLLSDFTEQYNFTHHLQVQAKIRTGELLSYRNEEGKMMVYHVED